MDDLANEYGQDTSPLDPDIWPPLDALPATGVDLDLLVLGLLLICFGLLLKVQACGGGRREDR